MTAFRDVHLASMLRVVFNEFLSLESRYVLAVLAASEALSTFQEAVGPRP